MEMLGCMSIRPFCSLTAFSDTSFSQHNQNQHPNGSWITPPHFRDLCLYMQSFLPFLLFIFQESSHIPLLKDYI